MSTRHVNEFSRIRIIYIFIYSKKMIIKESGLNKYSTKKFLKFR